MTLEEKIATVPKLERIDSSIESCIKILKQELEKREVEDPKEVYATGKAVGHLLYVESYFNIMKGKK